MKYWKFDYTISKKIDPDVFYNQCQKLERVATLIDTLIDVDGSVVRTFDFDNGKVNVYLDCEVGATYVKSDIPIDDYLYRDIDYFADILDDAMYSGKSLTVKTKSGKITGIPHSVDEYETNDNRMGYFIKTDEHTLTPVYLDEIEYITLL